MTEEKIPSEQIKTTDIGLKVSELIFGNPVITGILAITLLGTLVICVPESMLSKDITIPAITGIGGLASGVAIGKLAK